MKIRKLNEDIPISDPALAQQYASGQSQLTDKDKQINALQQQINKIEQDKINISKQMATIEAKSKVPAATTAPAATTPATTAPATTAPAAPASESLLIKEEDQLYINKLQSDYDKLTDELVTLLNMPISKRDSNYDNEIWQIKREIYELDQEIESEEYSIENQYSNDAGLTPNEDNWGYNELSTESFYDMSEAYIEDKTYENPYVDEYDQNDYIFYVRITDLHNSNEFIGKIFKLSPNGEWYGIVKYGENDAFEKISYDASYDENDVIEFLRDTYDEVDIINIDEFDNYIEGETDELTVRDLEESGMSGMHL